MSTPEGRIKARLNHRLKPFIDARQVHKLMPVQTGFGAVGLDYHLCVGGWYICVETKADATKKLTPRQEETKKHIEQAGGYVFVIYDAQGIDKFMVFVDTLVAKHFLKSEFARAA